MKLLKFLPGLSELFFSRVVLGRELLSFRTLLLDLVAEFCESLFSVLLYLGELFLCGFFFIGELFLRGLFFFGKFVEACLGLFLLPVARSDFLFDASNFFLKRT